MPPEHESPVIVVIDDDRGARDSLANLFASIGLKSELFGSVQDFLASNRRDTPGCMLLDVRLPGKSGLEFQREMQDKNIYMPVIIMTGHGDIPMTVSAMKAGAIEFLTKPIHEQLLLDAIQAAVARDAAQRRYNEEIGQIVSAYEQLSLRERQVMALVVDGLMNKQIAAELQLSEVTVKVHRGRLMHKMKAISVADLVKMSEKLQRRPVKR